jgi:hypothetical protein
MHLVLKDFSSADRMFNEGLEIAGQLVEPYGEVPAFPLRMAMFLRRVAQSQLLQRRGNDAIERLEQALALVKSHRDNDPGGHIEPDLMVALIKGLMAEVFLQSGDIERSEQHAVESIGAFDLSAVVGNVPAEKTHDLLISRTRLGKLFSELGRTDMSTRILRSCTHPTQQ